MQKVNIVQEGLGQITMEICFPLETSNVSKVEMCFYTRNIVINIHIFTGCVDDSDCNLETSYCSVSKCQCQTIQCPQVANATIDHPNPVPGTETILKCNPGFVVQKTFEEILEIPKECLESKKNCPQNLHTIEVQCHRLEDNLGDWFISEVIFITL